MNRVNRRERHKGLACFHVSSSGGGFLGILCRVLNVSRFTPIEILIFSFSGCRREFLPESHFTRVSERYSEYIDCCGFSRDSWLILAWFLRDSWLILPRFFKKTLNKPRPSRVFTRLPSAFLLYKSTKILWDLSRFFSGGGGGESFGRWEIPWRQWNSFRQILKDPLPRS